MIFWSLGARLGKFFMPPINPDAISVRATGILKALRSPNPCKIGSDLNPATTNGPARASWDKSGGENCGQMLDNRPNYGQHIRPMRIKIPLSQIMIGITTNVTSKVKVAGIPRTSANMPYHNEGPSSDQADPPNDSTIQPTKKINTPTAMETANSAQERFSHAKIDWLFSNCTYSTSLRRERGRQIHGEEPPRQ
jgi:hypothetical protein